VVFGHFDLADQHLLQTHCLLYQIGFDWCDQVGGVHHFDPDVADFLC
jgi:hypothetical protein